MRPSRRFWTACWNSRGVMNGLHSLLEEACRNVFFHSPRQSFLAGKSLREQVMEVLLPVMEARETPLAHPSEIADRLGALIRNLRDAAENLLFLLTEEKLAVSKHLLNALDSCRKNPPKNLPPKSTMWDKGSLDECLNKASKGKASDKSLSAFGELQDAVQKLKSDGELLRRALKVMPFVELARELSGQVPDFLKREGAVPAAFVPVWPSGAVGRLWRSRSVLPLGDEPDPHPRGRIQDTSREQWEAIHPLVLEALSRGGSLTWVGDVKQAIYGWRGGDATLFDEVRLRCGTVRRRARTRAVDILPTNWEELPGHRRNQQHPVPPAFRNSHG